MSESERKDSPEQAQFRSQCQAWLADNHPRQTAGCDSPGRTRTQRPRRHAMAAAVAKICL